MFFYVFSGCEFLRIEVIRGKGLCKCGKMKNVKYPKESFRESSRLCPTRMFLSLSRLSCKTTVKTPKKTAKIIARSNAKKNAAEYNGSISLNKIPILLLVCLGLFFLIMEIALIPDGAVIPAMLPCVIGVCMRVFVNKSSLREAFAACKVHIIFPSAFWR